MYYNIKPQKN